MSLRSTARSRLARLRPPSKRGSVTWGVNDQARWPERNRSDRSALDDPRKPVSEMRGKKAARAAPMSALRARSQVLGRLDVRAVDEQFGRRAGRQVLQQHGYVGRLCRLCRPCGLCGQVRPQILHARQQQQGVAGLAQLAFAALHVGAGLGGQAQGVLVVQGRGRARLAPPRSGAARIHGFAACAAPVAAGAGPRRGTGRPAPLRHPG